MTQTFILMILKALVIFVCSMHQTVRRRAEAIKTIHCRLEIRQNLSGVFNSRLHPPPADPLLLPASLNKQINYYSL